MGLFKVVSGGDEVFLSFNVKVPARLVHGDEGIRKTLESLLEMVEFTGKASAGRWERIMNQGSLETIINDFDEQDRRYFLTFMKHLLVAYIDSLKESRKRLLEGIMSEVEIEDMIVQDLIPLSQYFLKLEAALNGESFCDLEDLYQTKLDRFALAKKAFSSFSTNKNVPDLSYVLVAEVLPFLVQEDRKDDLDSVLDLYLSSVLSVASEASDESVVSSVESVLKFYESSERLLVFQADVFEKFAPERAVIALLELVKFILSDGEADYEKIRVFQQRLQTLFRDALVSEAECYSFAHLDAFLEWIGVEMHFSDGVSVVQSDLDTLRASIQEELESREDEVFSTLTPRGLFGQIQVVEQQREWLMEAREDAEFVASLTPSSVDPEVQARQKELDAELAHSADVLDEFDQLMSGLGLED